MVKYGQGLGLGLFHAAPLHDAFHCKTCIYAYSLAPLVWTPSLQIVAGRNHRKKQVRLACALRRLSIHMHIL